MPKGLFMKILTFPLYQPLSILTVFSVLMTSGCQVVSLKNRHFIPLFLTNVIVFLPKKKLSEASLNVLYMSGMDAKFACKRQKLVFLI